MFKLNNLTNEARQNKSYRFLTTDVVIQLYYSEVNLGWFITILYNDFKLENVRLTCCKNFLNHYRRKIKWGLKVTSKDDLDPYNIEDFVSDRIQLYFLTPDEVDYVTNIEYRYNSELLYDA
jgi:hypothetical protein